MTNQSDLTRLRFNALRRKERAEELSGDDIEPDFYASALGLEALAWERYARALEQRVTQLETLLTDAATRLKRGAQR